MASPIHISGLLIIVLLSKTSAFSFANELSPSQTKNATLPQQLASLYQDDIVVQDYWISEKLDGIRARWDGLALITRNANIIYAPAWFVKNFPPQTLDGELWLARNSFEKTASIVLRKTPTVDWKNIKFMLFDLPEHTGTFSQRLTAMQLLIDTVASPYLQVIPQFKLTDQDQLMLKLDELVAQGAEGLMLNHHGGYYQDGRSTNLLKLKKHQDAEARVIAHLPGKGKYQNMLGSLLVELDSGLQFKIGTGFSDIQRQNPPSIGTIITFKYYGLTAREIPRFASFLRVKPTAEHKQSNK
ncbi:DNA ligase [Paraglaciecola sp. MB-3u-78]|uniref:DNA ligase n=1 Tax=Paraglaciecola sp. MB-3u-78 TaxID=2058332 RepID=UPI000C347711|nr:DNA ligase [Paraglaciecola sp. MB-3u-78]PKG97217.1 DNA ligase [Paraglaciecola sp. MB-3u-78]